MMLPLLACSVFGLAVIIDRARAFRAAGSAHEALRKHVAEDLAEGHVEAATLRCEQTGGPVAATILAGLRRYKTLTAAQRRPDEVETMVSKTMEEYAPKALHGLQKRLNYLVLIASISPLLGMTGTVTGMIRSFDVMAASAGLDPGAVAGGIGEARRRPVHVKIDKSRQGSDFLPVIEALCQADVKIMLVGTREDAVSAESGNQGKRGGK